MTKSKSNRRRWLLFVAMVAVALLLGGAAGSVMTARGWAPFARSANGVPIYLSSSAKADTELNLKTGFSAVAKAVTPGVVTVETLSRVKPQPMPFFSNPFGDFFNFPWPGEGNGETPHQSSPEEPAPHSRLQATALGSGSIVSPDGYILTNNHVVSGADKIQVTLSDGRNFTAKLVGTDPPSDVAVLKIDATGLPAIPIGDSSQVQIGDVVLAIGNPLGIGETVTMGIVSAKGRSTDTGSGSYQDFLQTDAAINRGNSGGALVNVSGQLIGIPSEILSESGGNIGIGFAIPSAMARSVMDQLIRTGKVRRGKLGVTIGPLTPQLAKHFGYNGTEGALVEDVEAGQPAEKAGVKPGDIITEYQGQKVTDSVQFRNMVAQTAPGSVVKFKVWRDGAERELTATLADLGTGQTTAQGEAPESGAGALSGVTVESLTPALRQSLDLPISAQGVVVSDVGENSNAAGAGLQRGDFIEELNRQPISSVADFNAALQKAGKNSVLLRVRRRNLGSYYVVVPGQQ